LRDLPRSPVYVHYALVNASVVDLRYKMREVLTAIENSLQLVTANVKHFRCIRELDLKPFKPRNRK